MDEVDDRTAAPLVEVRAEHMAAALVRPADHVVLVDDRDQFGDVVDDDGHDGVELRVIHGDHLRTLRDPPRIPGRSVR